ncbi:hypothetical protein ACQVP2_22515 [Methylobacterium aquaticum]|uniref:hypothetical protein n=1 Tax=Methylobacterium aquaticum TaxID=270351 RepID=UPI003D16DF8D
MSRTDRQAAVAVVLMDLHAATPWHLRVPNSKTIMNAAGHPRVHILPVAGSTPADDIALAAEIAKLINEAAGVPVASISAPLDPDHLDALHEETQHAARQMGRRVVGR